MNRKIQLPIPGEKQVIFFTGIQTGIHTHTSRLIFSLSLSVVKTHKPIYADAKRIHFLLEWLKIPENHFAELYWFKGRRYSNEY